MSSTNLEKDRHLQRTATLPDSHANRGLSSTKFNCLFVLSNYNGSLNGKKTGWWLGEVAEPYLALTQAGWNVDFVSPKGGITHADENSISSMKDSTILNWFHGPQNRFLWENTMSPKQVNTAIYDAIFIPGGHGPLYDVYADAAIGKMIAEFYQSGKLVAAVCHGPAAFLSAQVGGEHIIKGKKITGFTNEEEKGVGLIDMVPFRLEDELKSLGARYQSGPANKSFVIVDGNLITGQNPSSSKELANVMIHRMQDSLARVGAPVAASPLTWQAVPDSKKMVEAPVVATFQKAALPELREEKIVPPAAVPRQAAAPPAAPVAPVAPVPAPAAQRHVPVDFQSFDEHRRSVVTGVIPATVLSQRLGSHTPIVEGIITAQNEPAAMSPSLVPAEFAGPLGRRYSQSSLHLPGSLGWSNDNAPSNSFMGTTAAQGAPAQPMAMQLQPAVQGGHNLGWGIASEHPIGHVAHDSKMGASMAAATSAPKRLLDKVRRKSKSKQKPQDKIASKIESKMDKLDAKLSTPPLSDSKGPATSSATPPVGAALSQSATSASTSDSLISARNDVSSTIPALAAPATMAESKPPLRTRTSSIDERPLPPNGLDALEAPAPLDSTSSDLPRKDVASDATLPASLATLPLNLESVPPASAEELAAPLTSDLGQNQGRFRQFVTPDTNTAKSDTLTDASALGNQSLDQPDIGSMSLSDSSSKPLDLQASLVSSSDASTYRQSALPSLPQGSSLDQGLNDKTVGMNQDKDALGASFVDQRPARQGEEIGPMGISNQGFDKMERGQIDQSKLGNWSQGRDSQVDAISSQGFPSSQDGMYKSSDVVSEWQESGAGIQGDQYQVEDVSGVRFHFDPAHADMVPR